MLAGRLLDTIKQRALLAEINLTSSSFSQNYPTDYFCIAMLPALRGIACHFHSCTRPATTKISSKCTTNTLLIWQKCDFAQIRSRLHLYCLVILCTKGQYWWEWTRSPIMGASTPQVRWARPIQQTTGCMTEHCWVRRATVIGKSCLFSEVKRSLTKGQAYVSGLGSQNLTACRQHYPFITDAHRQGAVLLAPLGAAQLQFPEHSQCPWKL